MAHRNGFCNLPSHIWESLWPHKRRMMGRLVCKHFHRLLRPGGYSEEVCGLQLSYQDLLLDRRFGESLEILLKLRALVRVCIECIERDTPIILCIRGVRSSTHRMISRESHQLGWSSPYIARSLVIAMVTGLGRLCLRTTQDIMEWTSLVFNSLSAKMMEDEPATCAPGSQHWKRVKEYLASVSDLCGKHALPPKGSSPLRVHRVVFSVGFKVFQDLFARDEDARNNVEERLLFETIAGWDAEVMLYDADVSSHFGKQLVKHYRGMKVLRLHEMERYGDGSTILRDVLRATELKVLDIRNSGDQSWDIPWCSSLTDMGLMRNVKSLRLCFDKHMEPRRIFQLMFAGHRGVGVLEDLHASVALDREFISTDDDIFLHVANLAEYCYPQRLPPTLKNLSIGVFLKTGEGMPLAHTAEHVDALHRGIVRFLGGSFRTLLSLTVFSTLSLEQFCCILHRLDNGKPFVVHSVRYMEYPWPMTMEDLVESDLYEGSMIQRNGFRVEWQDC